MKIKTKTLKIGEDTHRMLKVVSAEQNKSLAILAEAILVAALENIYRIKRRK